MKLNCQVPGSGMRGMRVGGRRPLSGAPRSVFVYRCLSISFWPRGQKYSKIKKEGSSRTLKQESQDPVKTQDPDEGKGRFNGQITG